MAVIDDVVTAWDGWANDPTNRNRVVDLDAAMSKLSELTKFSPLKIRVETIKILREQRKSANMDLREGLRQAIRNLSQGDAV